MKSKTLTKNQTRLIQAGIKTDTDAPPANPIRRDPKSTPKSKPAKRVPK